MIDSADPASRGREQLPLTIEVEAPAPRERLRRDYLILTLIASALCLAAFFHYWYSGELLLYGDAVAHMNIARRVVDSRIPGLLQLGTVWLPLPHVLMLPFIWSTWMWKTGVGGAIPSMAAFVFGVIGLFRLVYGGLSFLPNFRSEARTSAWFAALVYLLNPNLLYLAATAMTETLYLALFIWSTVCLSEFVQHLYRGEDDAARKSLFYTGVFLLLGMLTRYDGWFNAAVYGVAALVVLIRASLRGGLGPFYFLRDRSWRRDIVSVALLLSVMPPAWFVYNKYEFKDPLAFARGPYSARGIEQRTHNPGGWHHPGWNSPRVGATYFVESAKLNMASTERTERTWLYVALLGSVMLAGFIRPLWTWLLFWVPVPFYAISMAWGGVPIFIPKWWPFSYYNVRYGTQLIPLFAVFGALLLYLFLRRFSWHSMKRLVLVGGALFVLWSYYTVVRDTPICLREARVNARDRMAIEAKLANELSQLPPNSTVMMILGQHGGALQQIGFPLKRTVNECHKKYWYSALMNPALSADYVVATEGDPVSLAVQEHPENLLPVAELTYPRQATIRIYRSTTHQ